MRLPLPMDLVVPPPRCARFCRLPRIQGIGKRTHRDRKIGRPVPLQDDLEVLVGGEVAGPAAALRHLDDRCLQVAPRPRTATQAADPRSEETPSALPAPMRIS